MLLSEDGSVSGIRRAVQKTNPHLADHDRCRRDQQGSMALHYKYRTEVCGAFYTKTNFHLYKMQVAKRLLDGDKVSRLEFCQTFTRLMNQHATLINNLLMSDEAHYLSGTVNKQNMRYWSGENPCVLHQHPIHDPNSVVRCVVFHNNRAVFLWGWRWSSCHCKFSTLQAYASNFLCQSSMNMKMKIYGSSRIGQPLILHESVWHFCVICSQGT